MAFLLHQLLSQSAERFPEKEAVRFMGQGLTYAQLESLTNQLARSLIEAGVSRGDRVGLYVHKSLASVIGVFAIMRAGGVYVPFDPSAPAKRLAFMVQNCGIKVTLTSTEKMAMLPDILAAGAALETLILTDSEEQARIEVPNSLKIVSWPAVCEQEDQALPPSGAIETDLAYILYTSGSTGNPKGVMISHRTIFTFVNWCHETFGMTESDRVTSHAPLHFDLSTFDIFVTVKAGGTIVLVPEKLSIFPSLLVKLIQDEAISVIYMVPSILSLMVNYGKLDEYDLSQLRTVLFAGEVFPIKYLRKLVAAVPQPDYYNLYGPTETNVCTYYKVQPPDLAPERTQPVPIGKACENIEVFAVDEEGGPIMEPGVEGELWVRGSCVAQGYWGDREKTVQGFVGNRLQTHYDETAYRTGDIVILEEDGLNWRYVGRRDHMIKSRGYRIELGEIETALYSYDGVKEAAVVAIPDDIVGNRIKAYVVPLNNGHLTTAAMQAHLNSQLPRYMIPEIIEFLDELPKTSNGKVNRPVLAAAQPEAESGILEMQHDIFARGSGL